MKILFVDPRVSYGARTSSDQPLGGTQSAVTYLALALARAGVDAIVANRRPDDVVEDGVAWISLARLQQDFAAHLQAQRVTHLVVVSAPTVASLRPRIAWDGLWVLWNHHWIDQPALAPLSDPAVRDNWDAIVSLSAFHHDGMARAFSLPPERHWILRNAVGPHFAHLFRDWDHFRASREQRTHTRFAYTSTPFRGLSVLAEAWRTLGTRDGWSCTALSGMQLYGRDDDAEFASLFATVTATPGMTRLPPIGQAALADALAEHDFWGYPCTFVETSCISALEAVAAGLYPVTTALGALPETLNSWGTFVSPRPTDLVARWSAAALVCAAQREEQRIAWLHGAWTQREQVLREWTWDRRAREWIACLERIPPRSRDV